MRRDDQIGDLLFQGEHVDTLLNDAARAADQNLRDWDRDDLLNTSEADVISELLHFATVDGATIDHDGIELAPKPEDLRMDDVEFGERVSVTRTRWKLLVPLAGRATLVLRSSNTWGLNPPRGHLNVQTGELSLYSFASSAAAVRADFDEQIRKVQEGLIRLQSMLDAHNRLMEQQVPGEVRQRREQLLQERDIQEAIGFPIHRREDANRYAPAIRRKIAPPLPQARGPRQTAFEPEPTLNDADFEAALEVLRDGRNMLERNPSTMAKLNEEETRNLLLVLLNGQFKGAVAGEVFNGAGKTDILIRVRDRNIFIAECKIYDPKRRKGLEGLIVSALDQLMSYLVWRDSKAALILFIRAPEVSVIVDRVAAAIAEHRNWKRSGRAILNERYDYIFFPDSDAKREIHLAFLPFLTG